LYQRANYLGQVSLLELVEDVEAVILAVLGGLLGLWLGATIAHLSDVLVGLPAVVPAWAVVVALLTSSITGLVFGIYPAWRASQLDPIDALHYE